jgi:hypothetical protein
VPVPWLICGQLPAVWPGVRRAGLRRLSGGAGAGPGAAQRRRLINLLIRGIQQVTVYCVAGVRACAWRPPLRRTRPAR